MYQTQKGDFNHILIMIDYKLKRKKSQDKHKKGTKKGAFVCCLMSTYGGARSVRLKNRTAPP